MNRVPVQSSNLASVGYDTASKTLEIEFNSGAVWQYAGVPAGVHNAMMGADSVGKYFGDTIKGTYDGTRVG